MTPEEKALLDSTYTLVKENNDILRAMQRRGRISLALRIFYWVLIIGISLGAFYFIQPYIDLVRGLSSSNSSSPSYSEQLQDLLR
jgi:hypothetical protein